MRVLIYVNILQSKASEIIEAAFDSAIRAETSADRVLSSLLPEVPSSRDGSSFSRKRGRDDEYVLPDATVSDSKEVVAKLSLAEPQSVEACRKVLAAVKSHTEDGHLVAEVFMDLPSKEKYPLFFETVKRADLIS